MRARAVVSKTLATASALAVPLLLDAPPAGAVAESYAQTFNVSHEYLDLAGQTHRCQILGGSSLRRDSAEGAYAANASHQSEDCSGHFHLDVTYRNTAGTEVHVEVGDGFGPGTFGISWEADNVGSGLVARHSITFPDCSTSCRWEVTTSPK